VSDHGHIFSSFCRRLGTVNQNEEIRAMVKVANQRLRDTTASREHTSKENIFFLLITKKFADIQHGLGKPTISLQSHRF
jgi:hypothetical protein